MIVSCPLLSEIRLSFSIYGLKVICHTYFFEFAVHHNVDDK